MPKTTYAKPAARLNVAQAFTPNDSPKDEAAPKVVRRGVYIAVGVDRNIRKALAALDLGDKPSSYSELVEIALSRLLELGQPALEMVVDERHAQLDAAKAPRAS